MRNTLIIGLFALVLLFGMPNAFLPWDGSYQCTTGGNNWAGGTCQGSITFTTNTKLTSDLNVSNDIIIQTGVTLSTDGYSLEAGNALIMQGTANILTGSANNGGTSGTGDGIGGNGGSVFTGCSGTTCTSFGSSGGGGGAGYYICSPGSISVCQGNGGFGGNTIKQGGLGGLYTGTTDCDNGNLATCGVTPTAPILTSANIVTMIQAANTIQQYVRGGGGGGGGGGFVQTSGICPQIHYGGLAGIIPSSVDLSGNVIRFVTTQYTGGVGGAGANGIFIEANSMYIKTITAIGSVAGANDVAYAGGGGGGGGGSVILTYSSTGTYSAGTVTQTGGAGGTAGLYAGNGKNGALGTTNTFIYTQGSPAIPFVPFPGGGYTAPTLATCGTPTNTIVDVGQYVSETCTWTVGSLADAVTQNAFSSTNLANTMMTNTIASTSSGSVTNTFQVNSLFISPNSPFAFNIIVTDAHPTTINSVPSATVTIYSALSANPITAANNIYQGYSVGPATIQV